MCQKRAYLDRIAAELALTHMDNLKSEKRPVRSYPCPRCKGWHVTSQARRRRAASVLVG